MTSSHAIEVADLEKRFGAFRAVDRVSFHVETGEIFGYLGANGAGKSTTIRMLCGLLSPSGGSALVAGHDVARAPEKVKASIGYMSQKFSLYLDLTVEQNLRFFGGIYGLHGKRLEARIDELLGAVTLDGERRAMTGALPGGLRQKLALACSLLHQPKIVFLDEPTAGVDPVSRRAFWTLIRSVAKSGTTVFVTTHYMDEAEYCARIGLMVAGKLVALDTPAELKRTLVPGRTHAAHGAGVAEAAKGLLGRPGVLAAEPFGAGWHVRVEPSVLGDDALRAALVAAGARLDRFETVEATLEDVFLAAADGGTEASIRKGQAA